jgi:predicted Zn-dependent peptidase
MISFHRFTLSNGLRVLFHEDKNTPMAVVNTLYDVGARDEDPDHTGFAHLFEHLMFGGSVNIPDFDGPLQRAGGESNAFTSNDITNYYDVLPASNLETALWLESDRMLSLAFSDKSLETQRSVVIEEFKQRYLNQPYGDVWLNLRPLAYKEHPYQWATIGKEISHIEQATMDQVRRFFETHYHPSNAILCIAGNFEKDRIEDLCEKWYGDITERKKPSRMLRKEPEQTEYRTLTLRRDVPASAFYYAFKMDERKSEGYYFADLLSDEVGKEKSGRLYLRLKKELGIVNDINAYILGSLDEGLFIISGKLQTGKTFDELENALWPILEEFKTQRLTDVEMQRLKMKWKTSRAFQDQGLLNRAMNLSYFELLGDANGVNEESEIYNAISAEHLKMEAKRLFQPSRCARVFVVPQKNQ